jgi:hypothetical protein
MKTGILSIAVLLALSGIAQASIISVTLNGTIISGTDSADDFGSGSLAGDSFTLSFSYDPSLLTYQACAFEYQGLCAEGLERSTYGLVLNESVSVNTPSTYTQTGTLSCLQDSTPLIDALGSVSGGVSYSQFGINGSGSTCGGDRIGMYFVSTTPWAAGTILSQSAMDLMVSTLDPQGGGSFSIDGDEGAVQWSAQQSTPDQSTPEPPATTMLALGLGCVALLRRAAGPSSR